MHGMAPSKIDLYRAFVDFSGWEHGITMEARATGGLEAEIASGGAAWFLVHTFAGDDLRAMRWLARRRFGVFRPMQQRKVRRNENQPIGVMEPVFPGWLFVYVFGMTAAQYQRILKVPGIFEVLCYPNGGPVPIPDQFVDDLRALSWVVSDRLGWVGRTAGRNINRVRRATRSERRQLEHFKKTAKVLGVEWNPDLLDQIRALAPDRRITFIAARLKPLLAGSAPLGR